MVSRGETTAACGRRIVPRRRAAEVLVWVWVRRGREAVGFGGKGEAGGFARFSRGGRGGGVANSFARQV